ncbi:MAG: serine/threonine-protein kinase, partial [Sphingomonadales bacterium]
MNSEHFHALPKGYKFEDFEIVRVLGYGGFGITYLAFDDNLNKPVAIKEYLPEALAVREDTDSVVPKSSSLAEKFKWGLDRFVDEARTLARFRHPQLVQVFHFFRANGTAYIVMEYIEGEELSEIIRRRGKLRENDLKAILLPILEGLELVHEAGILHRDIKPGNIMIRDDGSPVLIDFGAARLAVGAKSRSLTAIVSAGYAPLEQYVSRGNQGPWTDIYALGATAYKCLTGEKPPEAPARTRKDPYKPLGKAKGSPLSEAFAEAINKALAVNEENRPQTIGDWRVMLEASEEDGKEDARTKADQMAEDAKEEEKGEAGKEEAEKGAEKPSGEGFVKILVVLLVLAVAAAGYSYWPLLTDAGDIPASVPSSAPSSVPSAVPAPQPVEPAKPDPLILQAQELFNRLDYQLGPPDGRMTPRTEAAVRAFEKDQGLVPAGVIDALLIEKLKAELARRDEAAWQAAVAAGSVPAFENYRKAWPKGAHVGEVGDAIQKLKAAKAEAAAAAKRQSAEAKKKAAEKAKADDDKAWADAKRQDTVKAFEDYRKARPRGAHAGDVDAEIARLQAAAEEVRKRKAAAAKLQAEEAGKKAAEKAKEDDEKAWTDARQTDTIKGYQDYRKAWPKGAHLAEAEAEIARLEAVAAEAAKLKAAEAAKRQAAADDEKAWAAAEKANTIKAFEDYRQTRPKGKHAGEVDGRIAKLKDEAAEAEKKRAANEADERAWADAKAKNTVKGYEAYLKARATGKYAAQAAEEIKKLIAAANSPEALDRAAWKLVEAEATAKAYRRYLLDYPSGAQVREARLKFMPFELTLEKTYGGPLADEANAIAALSGGGFVLAGTTATSDTMAWDGWVLGLNG